MAKKHSTILGLAIGDALGQPFEFSSAHQIIQSGWDGGMTYGDVWKLQSGQWTDDTKMALNIAESLIENGDFNIEDVAKRHVSWVESGDLRGIGTRCAAAISNMAQGIPSLETGRVYKNSRPSFKRVSNTPSDPNSLHGPGDFCGCGTVMRCAPIGLFFHKDEEKMAKVAKLDATMTHDHPDARDSSELLCKLISDVVKGNDVNQLVKYYISNHGFEYDHVPRLVSEAIDMAGDKSTTFVDAIKLGTQGSAHETLASALYCFLRYFNFRDAVTSAVLIGGDTDSRAAIVGALAGTRYGIEGIPPVWIEQVEDSKRLQEIDKRLLVM